MAIFFNSSSKRENFLKYVVERKCLDSVKRNILLGHRKIMRSARDAEYKRFQLA